MLDAEYLADLPESVVKIWHEVEEDILCDLAKRIKDNDYLIASSIRKAQLLANLGAHQDYVIDKLAAATKKSEKEVSRIMSEAFTKGLKDDLDKIRVGQKLAVIEELNINTEKLNLIANKGIKALNGNIKNFTNTYAAAVSQKYEWAIDKAYLNVQSGYMTQEQAVKESILDLFGNDGLPHFVVRNGRREQLETVVRRAVVTGTNQTMSKMQIANCEDLGCDLVEVSSHYGARPSHAEWQGGIFSLSGESKKYPDFVRSTGYGSIDGLCGVNCRHSFYPFFEGLSTKSFERVDLNENREHYKLLSEERRIKNRLSNLNKQKRVFKIGAIDTSNIDRKIKYSKIKLKITQAQLQKSLATMIENDKYRDYPLFSEELKYIWNGLEKANKRVIRQAKKLKEESGVDVYERENIQLAKKLWINELVNLDFPERTYLCDIPSKIQEKRPDLKAVYVKRSDLAYIMWRHYEHLTYEEFLKMEEVVRSYDLLLDTSKANHKGGYTFYKMCGRRGFEVAIQEREESTEFVVHYLKYGTKKTNSKNETTGEVQYTSLKRKYAIIDEKKKKINNNESTK